MIAFLRRLYRAIRPTPAEPVKWAPTGFRYTTERTHDQTKGSAAYARSRTQTPSGRPIPRPVPADTDTRAKVVQMPKTSRG